MPARNSRRATRRPVRSLLLFVAALCGTLAGCAAGGETPRYPEGPQEQRSAPFSILVLGDTQSPLGIETLRLAADDNEEATRQIFRAVARDSSCSAVIHLGDLTALGDNGAAWDLFDEEAEPVRAHGTPIYPVVGNHDLMPFAEPGMENLLARFPFVGEGWYERRIGPVAVLFLNSNFGALSREEREQQERWYRRALGRLEADSAVAVVLVACHHPPFTNSTVVEPDEEVRRVFVPPYLNARKALLFLSGHAHAFEHFRVEGKDFIVSGGGGGLLHPLRRGSEARRRDLYEHETDRSFFHYLRLTPFTQAAARRLAVEVRRRAPDRRGFETAYRADIP